MGRNFLPGFLAGLVFFFVIAFLFLPAYSVSVVSSPGAEGEVLALINSAQDSVYIEMYLLSSREVEDALILARMRGVDVKVILEERVSSDANSGAFSRLSASGISVCTASEEYRLAHSKVIIVDGKKALVGSHNLSDSALNYNREISLLVEGNVVSELLELFRSDWGEACLA